MSHMSELDAEEQQAMMDADEDRYSETKDDPEYTAQEHWENRGCYQCHQKREA